jgi:hypothetical protein
MTLSLHPDRARMTTRRAADAPRRPASPTRVALADCWRALTRTLHDTWCLPELGGCEEELVDIRRPGERGIAQR